MSPIGHRPISRQRSGFNLVEAAIVLGVVGLVIGGIWSAASSVARNQKANDTATAISTVYNNLVALYSNQRPPDNQQQTYLSYSRAAMLGMFPSLKIDDNGGIQVNDLTLFPAVSKDYFFISIAFPNGPNWKECQFLANYLLRSFRHLSPSREALDNIGYNANLAGGMGDEDLSTPEAIETNCPIQDSINLVLAY